MPSKSHRAASRQARLRQRKQRGKGAVQEFDPGPSESTRRLRDEDSDPASAPRASLAEAARRPARAAGGRRGAPQVDDSVPRYEYLGRELGRIGILSGLIGLVLVGLTFVLG